MPTWLRRLTSPRSYSWSDEEENLGPPLSISMGEKTQDFTKSGVPTPATSTAVDHILPPPATHSHDSNHTKIKSARLSFGVYWMRLKKQLGTGAAPSNSSFIGDSTAESCTKREGQPSDEDGEVDTIVVDRVWSEEIKSSESPPSDHGANALPLDKSIMGHTGQTVIGNVSEHESEVQSRFARIWKPFVILRYKLYPTLREFFFTRFGDEKSESHYAQEDWILKKGLAIWAALWLIVNWVLGVAFLDRDTSSGPNRSDIAFYFVVGPLLAFPVLWMVIYDWPRNRPILYQLFLVVAIWAWGFYFVLFIKICHFYPPKIQPDGYKQPECASRDFLGLFFYTTALQTMGLFGLKLNRLMAAIGAFSFFIMTSSLMIPAKSSWVRNMINFFVFHFFLIYVHYMRENSERRLYTLRYQLKIQYRATQKAQVNERKTADSKRRLTSYVFHDKCHCHGVRVPLNTALLAVQNMEASGNIMKDQQIEFNALSGSLSMMSKVLNDVLDFNKMDSGKFESASRPYAFHQAMRSLFIPLGLATDARSLTLETYLDPNIDIIARKAAYEALGEKDLDVIRRHIEDNPNAPGVVTGDETRLRQVVTNLASNACKFTPAGGKLKIRTKLVFPVIPPGGDLLRPPQVLQEDGHDDRPRYPLSVSHLSQHDTEQELEQESKKAYSRNRSHPSAERSQGSPAETIVVRIEVEDTGYGIKPCDMHKLFTAFNQTEQGRQQGGKGTGLGLALVRQIVKLSGGRLGVQSKVGRGSTFWVELPLGIGSEAVTTQPPPAEPEMSRGSNHVEYVHGQALMRTGTNGTVDGASIPAAKDAAGKGRDTGPAAARTNSALHSLMDQAGRFEIVLRKHDSDDRVSKRAIGDPSTGTQYSSPIDSVSGDKGDVTVQDGSTASSIMGTPNASPLTTPQSEKGSDGKSVTTTMTTTTTNAIASGSKSASYSSMDMAPRAPSEESRGSETRLESSSNTPVPGNRRVIQRPTFVQLPSPRTFSMDTHGPPCSPSAIYTPAIGSSYSSTSTSPLAMFDASHARGSPSSLNAGMNFESAAGMSVLVVDDDSLTRTLMKRILTRLGCQVSLAENGEVALEMILGRRISIPLSTPSSDYSKREAKPILEQEITPRSTSVSTPTGSPDEYKYAVVFLDNQMPVMSGLKVVAKLRELGRKDFVVGVTGNALLTDQQEYLDAGVDKVLTKPVLERSLRDVLQCADERRKNVNRETSSPEAASGDRASPS